MSAAEQTLKPLRVTPQEYLERERAAEYKSEYVDGRVFPMGKAWKWDTPGSSARRSLLVANIVGQLHAQLKGRAAQVCVGAAVGSHGNAADVAVAAEGAQFADANGDVLVNPTVLLTTFSHGSGVYRDWAHFRQVRTVTEYITVSQDEVWVEHWARQNDDRWLFTDLRGPDAVLHLPSIGCELPLSEIYARVEFPPAEEES